MEVSGLSSGMRQTGHRILAGGNSWATNFANFGVLVFKTVITGL